MIPLILSSVKIGDAEGALSSLALFLPPFKTFIRGRPEALKVRLYDFAGSVVDSAILGGGDEKKMNDMAASYFGDIERGAGMDAYEDWMARAVSEAASAVVRVHEKRSKALVKNALAYIDAHYSRSLSYKEVAKQVFVSPSYFLCIFKRETGLTFVDYLTTVRIERAKALLSLTDKGIAEIAYEVGFRNSNYFSSIFRKTTGKTAREYRERK